MVNEGNGYNTLTNTFVVPLDGSYFFSVVTPSGAHLTVNSNIVLCVCLCVIALGSAISSGLASVMTLNNGDVVRVKALTVRLNIISNQDGLTSFRGFHKKTLSKSLNIKTRGLTCSARSLRNITFKSSA